MEDSSEALFSSNGSRSTLVSYSCRNMRELEERKDSEKDAPRLDIDLVSRKEPLFSIADSVDDCVIAVVSAKEERSFSGEPKGIINEALESS
jgi:hypothetical protein